MIAVLDYGIGNLRSAEKALQHVGGDARLIASAADAAGADAVVLPGVGAFGACMNALRASGLDAVVLGAIDAGKPFLGICVGLQMLYEASDESPGVAGLGVIPGTVERMITEQKLPQMQWNQLDMQSSSPLFDGLAEKPWMYFVHTFAVPSSSEVVATCDYGAPVVAMVQRDNLWATQFHPEKSGSDGLRVLQNFVRLADQ
jgi:imidazole glycerol-phosphate synthase subunit HisH